MLAPSILKFFSLFIHSLSWELLSFLMIYLFSAMKKVANLTLRYLVPSDFHDIPGWAIWFMHISFSWSLVISAIHFAKNQRPWRDSWTLDSTFCLCIHLSLTVKRIERPLMRWNFLWQFGMVDNLCLYFWALKLLWHHIWSLLPLFDVESLMLSR